MLNDKANQNLTKSTLLQYAGKIWTLHLVIVALALFIVILSDKLLNGTILYLIITVVCTSLFACLCYSESWRTAARDRNLVLYSHLKYDRYKGLKGALCSQAPGILFALAAVLIPSFTFAPKFLIVMYAFAAYPLRGLAAAFPPIYFVPILIPFAAMPLGYAFGYKEFRLLTRIVWKNASNKPKKKRENLR